VSVGNKAYIDATAEIGDNVTIGENAYIGPGVTLMPGVVIQPGAIVLAGNYPADPGATPPVPAGGVPPGTVVTKNDVLDSVIAGSYTAGAGISVASGAVIGAGATFGANVAVGNGARIGAGADIGDDVVIGANVYIAPGVTIAAGITIPDGAVILDDVPVDTEFTTPQSVASSVPGLTVTIGQAVGQTMTIKPTDLRQGAMLDLIRQDTTGAYGLEITDPDVIAGIADAIQQVASERASLGASQSRLELAATTLSVEYENLSSAISRIRDVDVAKESTQFAKYNILVQSGTAMLSQANQTPQSVLKLLQS